MRKNDNNTPLTEPERFGEDDELMDADQFKAVVMGMRLQSSAIVRAAYSVLVLGSKVNQAVEKYGVSQPHLSGVLSDIRTNIETVGEKVGAKYRSLYLSDEEYLIVKMVQDKRLKPFLESYREGWEKYGLDEEFDTGSDGLP